MSVGFLSKLEILAKYPDRASHEKLLKLRALADILERSIVEDSYEVPHRLAACISLSTAGARLVSRVRSNANPRNESILAVFIEMWWDDLLVDPDSTDIEALLSAVSDEVKRGAVRHPYIYGRLLYDKAFEEYPEGRTFLNRRETLGLLAGTPKGVFQLDEFVTGPFGVLRSESLRYVPPTVDFPLYHCEDLACNAFHSTRLTTGSSRIAKVRSRVRDVLQRNRQVPSEWSAVLLDRLRANEGVFVWNHARALIRFLGDAFSVDELRLILREILDAPGGVIRRKLRDQEILVKDAEEFVATLNDAATLQLILVASNGQIADSIDRLVLTRKIIVPVTEVRRPAVMQGGGYFHVFPECSQLGVRFVGSRDSALLRVRHLISRLFDQTDPNQVERLTWLLRGSAGETFDQRLENFICQGDLNHVIRAVSFDSNANLEVAKSFVSLGPRAAGVLSTDDELSSAIAWRMGVQDPASYDEIREFTQFGEQIRKLAIEKHSYSSEDQAAITGLAVNFFNRLERLLRAYLKLATWALYRDHYGSVEGFVYADAFASDYCSAVLSSTQSNVQFSADGKWTLYPLTRGFDILADALVALETSDETRRPESEKPRLLVEHASPYSFLFLHRHTFLDLSTSSKGRAISTLREASRKLVAGRVDATRNLFGHDNPFPSQDRILAAVDAAEAVIAEAEEAGFLPLPAELRSDSRDEFGRRFVTMGTSRGKLSSLVRPSGSLLSGLPNLMQPQLIIRVAGYANSREVLRLSVSAPSEYARIWDGFPRRRGGVFPNTDGATATLES
ncbi:hypothetical protein ACIOBK_18820 [Micromonospora chokoriensis]